METILGQGTFTVATGVPKKVIQVPQGADIIRVRNYSRWGVAGEAATPFAGVEYFWQRGMPNGSALYKYYGTTNTAVVDGIYHADAIALGAGFTLYDPSGQDTGAVPLTSTPVAVGAVSNATRPVVTGTVTTGIAAGDVVRISATTSTTFLAGIDWVVGSVDSGTQLTLLFAGNALATAPGNTAGAGTLVKVNYNPLYYPRYRYITNIVIATKTISTSIAHGYYVGQKVRFKIPDVSGMIQLNPTPANRWLTATITGVTDAYNFVVDTDMTGFTTFTTPTRSQQPSDWPQVIPVGEDTPYALTNTSTSFNAQNILSDATINEGFIGVILGTGGLNAGGSDTVSGPAGFAAGNVMYWEALKASYVNI